MKHTTIDPKDALILFADLQVGIADLPMTISADKLRKGVRGLSKLAKILDLPFLVTAVMEQGQPAVIMPEIEQELGTYTLNYRTTADSWRNEEILSQIEATGRKTILISGVATEIAVSLPAISFAADGYRSFVVTDACGGMSQRTEEAALNRVMQAGGSVTSVLTLAGELAGDFRDPSAQACVGVLFEMAVG